MDLQKVNVSGAQTLETRLNGLENGLPGKPSLIDVLFYFGHLISVKSHGYLTTAMNITYLAEFRHPCLFPNIALALRHQYNFVSWDAITLRAFPMIFSLAPLE